GLIWDTKNPRKVGTYIDQFYAKCKIPIVTTFHSGPITLSQWITPSSLVKKSGKMGKLGIPLRALLRYWKYFLNYQAFNNITKEKLRMSRAGIVFSHYMSKLLDHGDGSGSRCHVIYHGSEPAICPPLNKKEAREKFSLPQEDGHRIALAHGFRTAGKGWDILKKMNIPKGWTLVVNSSKDYYNKENLELNWQGATNILDLRRGYLREDELSTLFYACDAVILPYKVTAGSGVMFDALSHGLPFVATDLRFFREFAAKGLGITAKRNPHEFSKGLESITSNYAKYKEAVNMFKEKLKWDSVAKQHSMLYHHAATRKE
ncbi:MAG TPA: glycosyltransferase, partial [Nitrososphaeraceae archaeon]|nr:glycosyltransferase [Nitrososphaeraceae archaeon]